ncbi:MAG: translation elongation factor Ts [Bacteroidota bacterium]
MDKTAKLAALKTLRKKTRSGVMDCSEALKAAEGNIEKAIDLLYIKAQKKVEKLRKNETTQHFVFGGTNTQKDEGVLIQLSCQTDFVGNDSDFVELANKIVDIALNQSPATPQALLEKKIGSQTAQEKIEFWMAAFGENIVLSGYQRLKDEHITCFVHSNKKSASLVATNSKTLNKEQEEALHHVAMQITTSKPMAITPQEVADKLQAGGKKIPNIEKIAESKALLTQPFFQNEAQTIEQYLQEKAPTIEIKAFLRIPQGKK